jgi:hypothetical protein
VSWTKTLTSELTANIGVKAARYFLIIYVLNNFRVAQAGYSSFLQEPDLVRFVEEK